MRMNIISLDNVNVTKNSSIILKNLNLDIERGKLISIIGSNGSGKSTFINFLYGYYQYEGYVEINGYYLNKKNVSKIRRTVSIINGDDYGFIYRRVIDELVFPLENIGMKESEIQKKIKAIVSLFKLEKFLYSSVNNISNSKRQVVMFAQALITDPDILLVDDAMHQMDMKDKELIFKILNMYKKNNTTILMSTHDVEDTLNSDKIIVMDKGSIILVGSVISIYKNREKLKKIGIGIPFVIDLSLRLIDKGIIKYVYKDMRKLVDSIWK